MSENQSVAPIQVAGPHGQLVSTALGRLAILRAYNHVAMVGLSANPIRPSHFVATYLLCQGYKIFPVNPAYKEIPSLGLPCYPDLASVPAEVEIVDVFRKPVDVPSVVTDAINVGAKVVWMQLGIVNEEAARQAIAAGLDVVMNRCMKIEHARFHGGLNLVGVSTGVISSRRKL